MMREPAQNVMPLEARPCLIPPQRSFSGRWNGVGARSALTRNKVRLNGRGLHRISSSDSAPRQGEVFMAERNDPYGSLVGDLLGLGKIGEILLGSLSKLVGGIAAPHQVRRLGLAETDVEADRLIRMTEAQALADAIKRGDMGLRDRTGSRLLARELDYQLNQETTFMKGVALIIADREESGEDGDPEVEPDWMDAWFRYVETVSNAEIQTIWARILAAKMKGGRRAVSLATLDSLRLLEPHLARAFERIAKAWAAFGVVIDIDVGDEALDLSIYTHDHMALQGLGLIDIISKREYYLQAKGFAFVFSKSEDPPLDDIPYHDADFGQIRLSRRGIELCGALFPGLLEWDPRMAGQFDATPDLAAWSRLEARTKVIESWRDLLGSMSPALLLGHHASSSPESMMVRSEAVFTHVFTAERGWKRLGRVTGSSSHYPPEVLALLGQDQHQQQQQQEQQWDQPPGPQ